ncbi:hypothetical protein JKP88DRAFT_61652 [Tribonema minus]|uniref:Uncharacterized protein n=1 Tax=Tribonema minus TaxID=303371 RepID=A0A835YWA6_9STRA|nr:hypothetical protein JKP88DRAFT_61652 [Tribonema minus]
MLNGTLAGGQRCEFTEALLKLLKRLMARPRYQGECSPSDMACAIMRKASRTASGCDSYHFVHQLYGADENYLLKPRAVTLPPVEVEVSLVDSCIISKVITRNPLALYKMADLENSAAEAVQVEPWLYFDTTVTERTNHDARGGSSSSGNDSIRYLSVAIPEDPSDINTCMYLCKPMYHFQEQNMLWGADAPCDAPLPLQSIQSNSLLRRRSSASAICVPTMTAEIACGEAAVPVPAAANRCRNRRQMGATTSSSTTSLPRLSI